METIKISLLGDIMCEPRMLKASRKRDENYDFSGVFQNVRSLLEESDFVIGNFETPLAGKSAGYVQTLFQFNAPDSFALAAKKAGIDLLLTANNHCLDRGLAGLKRTVDVLDEYNMLHAGSFSDTAKRGNTYFQIDDMRFAVVAYTYGTNYSDNHLLLSKDEQNYVNLLRPQTESYFIPHPQKKSFKQRVLWKISGLFRGEKRFYVRKWLKLPINFAHADDNLETVTLKPYLDQLFSDIENAKKCSDFVLFCPHIGGQFNKIPGEFSRYIFSVVADRNVDAIVASHAHVVQEAQFKGKIPCFYSLGNFSMSPNSVYLLHENLPNYGIVAHLYFGKNGIIKTSFSILKIVEDDMLTVWPVDEYVKSVHLSELEMNKLNNDVKQIYHTVTNEFLDENIFRREYELG